VCLKPMTDDWGKHIITKSTVGGEPGGHLLLYPLD
jgi:hypothetical protein